MLKMTGLTWQPLRVNGLEISLLLSLDNSDLFSTHKCPISGGVVSEVTRVSFSTQTRSNAPIASTCYILASLIQDRIPCVALGNACCLVGKVSMTDSLLRIL